MNLDDLKTEWRNEMEHVDDIRVQVTELRQGIRFGSFWIIFAFLAVAVIEMFEQFVALDNAGWLSKVGAVAWVCLTLWLAVVLRRSSQVERSDDWTLRSRLEIEIERAQKHRDTWKRMAAWYLAPMLATVVLSTLGGSHDKTGSYAPGLVGWVLLGTCAALFAFVYWYCQREIRRKLDPLLARLKGLYTELTGTR
jgi:hypothetical protein